MVKYGCYGTSQNITVLNMSPLCLIPYPNITISPIYYSYCQGPVQAPVLLEGPQSLLLVPLPKLALRRPIRRLLQRLRR